jgi:hypothetical protein
MGIETKNDCAGEDHQQFTGLDYLCALFVGDGVIFGLDGAFDNNWWGFSLNFERVLHQCNDVNEVNLSFAYTARTKNRFSQKCWNMIWESNQWTLPATSTCWTTELHKNTGVSVTTSTIITHHLVYVFLKYRNSLGKPQVKDEIQSEMSLKYIPEYTFQFT